MALDFCYLYVTQSDFTREEARLPMVEDIWTGGGGGGGGQLPRKLLHKEKAGKKYNAKRFTQKKQGAN